MYKIVDHCCSHVLDTFALAKAHMSCVMGKQPLWQRQTAKVQESLRITRLFTLRSHNLSVKILQPNNNYARFARVLNMRTETMTVRTLLMEIFLRCGAVI